MATTINQSYINAILADASYLNLDTNINTELAKRISQPVADFITSNFDVVDQEVVQSEGFSATVWRRESESNLCCQVQPMSVLINLN